MSTITCILKHSVDSKHFQFNTVRISNSKNANTQVYTALFKFWSLLIRSICRTTPMYLENELRDQDVTLNLNWGCYSSGKTRRCIHCPPLTVRGNKTTSGRSPFITRQAHYGGIDSLCNVCFLLQIWPWVPCT